MKADPPPQIRATRVTAFVGALAAVWMCVPLNHHAVLPWTTSVGLVLLYGASALLAGRAATVAGWGLVAGVVLHALFGFVHAGPAAAVFGFFCVAPLFVGNRIGQRSLGWFGSLVCVFMLALVLVLQVGVVDASTVALRWSIVALLGGLLMGRFPAGTVAEDDAVGQRSAPASHTSRMPRPVVASVSQKPPPSMLEGDALRHAARSFHHLMGVVLTSAEIVRDEMREQGAGGTDLDILVRKANEASALALRLLTVARDDTTDTGSIEISPFLSSLNDDFAAIAGPGIEVDVQVLPGLAPLHMDASQLSDVLFELVRNAAEAMQGQGTLTVAAYVDRSVPAGCMRLVVEDDGPGMPSSMREQAFRPFYTSRRGALASGLGLSVVKSVVRRCGGQVQIESGDSGGTRVCLDLPVVPASDGMGMTGGVVVVGSDDGECGVVASLLRDAGYSVRFVVDSGQALQALSIADGAAELVLLEASDANRRLANFIARDWEHLDVVWLGRGMPDLSPSVQVLHNVPVYAVVDELVRMASAA